MFAPVFSGGLPGAPELIVIVMMFLLMAVPVVGIVLLVAYLANRGGDESERIAELEAEVESLRRRVEDDEE